MDKENVTEIFMRCKKIDAALKMIGYAIANINCETACEGDTMEDIRNMTYNMIGGIECIQEYQEKTIDCIMECLKAKNEKSKAS